jgi:hypothetical protein
MNVIDLNIYLRTEPGTARISYLAIGKQEKRALRKNLTIMISR